MCLALITVVASVLACITFALLLVSTVKAVLVSLLAGISETVCSRPTVCEQPGITRGFQGLLGLPWACPGPKDSTRPAVKTRQATRCSSSPLHNITPHWRNTTSWQRNSSPPVQKRLAVKHSRPPWHRTARSSAARIRCRVLLVEPQEQECRTEFSFSRPHLSCHEPDYRNVILPLIWLDDLCLVTSIGMVLNC